MNNKRILMGLLVVVLALILSVGLIQAQEAEPPDESLAPDEPEAVSNTIPIQGRATDSNGVPLNGVYDITATIYGPGGVALCTDTDPVEVVDGLFNMPMDFCSSADIQGDALQLGVQVEADPEMTPRQTIYPVPYAFTVRPGAIIKGADSYLFVPGLDFIKNKDTDTTRWELQGAGAKIYRGATAGAKYIRIPITIPAVLYGQPMKVTNVRIYYRCENGGNNHIAETRLYKATGANTWDYIVNNIANRTSNSATYYDPPIDSAQNTLSQDEGLLVLYLKLDFANDTEYVQIAGVRLTLDANY